jgi:hypothetical protein
MKTIRLLGAKSDPAVWKTNTHRVPSANNIPTQAAAVNSTTSFQKSSALSSSLIERRALSKFENPVSRVTLT